MSDFLLSFSETVESSASSFSSSPEDSCLASTGLWYGSPIPRKLDIERNFRSSFESCSAPGSGFPMLK